MWVDRVEKFTHMFRLASENALLIFDERAAIFGPNGMERVALRPKDSFDSFIELA